MRALPLLIFLLVSLIAIPAHSTRQIDYGLNINICHFPWASSDQWLEELNASGAGWVRTELRYFNESTIQDPNDPANQTIAMLTLVKQCNLSVDAIFDEMISPWIGNSSGEFQPITSLDQWKSLVDDALTAYGGFLDAVECWNEPDMINTTTAQSLGFYMDGTPEHYANMLQVLWQETKAYNPNIKVIAGAVATVRTSSNESGSYRSGGGFLNQICELNASSYCDCFSIHVYDGYLDGAEGINSAADAFNQAESLVSNAKPIWITEIGANHAPSLDLQNAFVNASFASLKSNSDCSMVMWYDYYPLNSTANPENFWNGIVGQDLTERPDYYTFRNFAAPIPGDVNNDGTVDSNDILIIVRAFGSTHSSPNWNPAADINGDGTVNMKDIALVARNFGSHYP